MIFFNAWHLDAMQVETYQPLGMVFLVWGIIFFLVLTPIITYFVGKRWYCSWICGCGGLAETTGDPFRHLSSKKLSAWKLERWMIHSVLVLVFIMTSVTLYGYFAESSSVFGISIYEYFQKPYGFLIGATFSGVIGVGFYPILGSRVWVDSDVQWPLILEFSNDLNPGLESLPMGVNVSPVVIVPPIVKWGSMFVPMLKRGRILSVQVVLDVASALLFVQGES